MGMMDYHFEDKQVIDAIQGTQYLKDNVDRHLHHMTSGEKWSLYRAIAKLISEREKFVIESNKL